MYKLQWCLQFGLAVVEKMMNGQLYIYFNDDHTAPKSNAFSLVNQFDDERWVFENGPISFHWVTGNYRFHKECN